MSFLSRSLPPEKDLDEVSMDTSGFDTVLKSRERTCSSLADECQRLEAQVDALRAAGSVAAADVIERVAKVKRARLVRVRAERDALKEYLETHSEKRQLSVPGTAPKK